MEDTLRVGTIGVEDGSQEGCVPTQFHTTRRVSQLKEDSYH